MSLRPSCATEKGPGDPGKQCKTLFQKEKPKQRDFIPNKSRISNWRVYLTMKFLEWLTCLHLDLIQEMEENRQCYQAQSDSRAAHPPFQGYDIVSGHLDPLQGKPWGDLISESRLFSFMNVALKAEQNWGDCDKNQSIFRFVETHTGNLVYLWNGGSLFPWPHKARRGGTPNFDWKTQLLLTSVQCVCILHSWN